MDNNSNSYDIYREQLIIYLRLTKVQNRSDILENYNQAILDNEYESYGERVERLGTPEEFVLPFRENDIIQYSTSKLDFIRSSKIAYSTSISLLFLAILFTFSILLYDRDGDSTNYTLEVVIRNMFMFSILGIITYLGITSLLSFLLSLFRQNNIQKGTMVLFYMTIYYFPIYLLWTLITIIIDDFYFKFHMMEINGSRVPLLDAFVIWNLPSIISLGILRFRSIYFEFSFSLDSGDHIPKSQTSMKKSKPMEV